MNLSRKRLGRGAGVLVGLIVVSIVFAGPAQADIPKGSHPGKFCKKGTFCIFDNPNYKGDGIRDGVRRTNVGDFMNDRATSLWNRTGHKVCVYQNAYFDGAYRAIKPGESHHDLRNDYFTDEECGRFSCPASMNDRISSWGRC
jgi:hypothetical protein